MAFLRVQKLKRNDEGQVVSGSAELIRSVYDRENRHKNRQELVESLGKVVWYDKEGKKIIVFSPSRGLVEYNDITKSFSDVDSSDERVAHLSFAQPPRHLDFGPAHVFLSLLEKEGFSHVLTEVFRKQADLERVVCHIAHSFLKEGSKVACDDFIYNSSLCAYARHIPLETLQSDTCYFEMMGRDDVKAAFFQSFVKMMRKRHRNFGQCCYVDSTPLPNDMTGNPFNAFSSHGTGGAMNQSRLALVLDRETGVPVWFSMIYGSINDMNTMKDIRAQVKEYLDLEISELVLDAGYFSKELAMAILPAADTEETVITADPPFSEEELKELRKGHRRQADTFSPLLIARMSARNPYPYKTIYHKVKDKLNQGKYAFVLNGHSYFACRLQLSIFGRRCFAYAYVDNENANKAFRDYMDRHGDEFEKLADRDKSFRLIEGGHFVLLSTERDEPKYILSQYFSRTDIEGVFKTGKEYLSLLPLSKWTESRVLGKILSDIITLQIYLIARKKLNDRNLIMTRSLTRLQAHKALLKLEERRICPEYQTAPVKEIYSALKIKTEPSISVDDYFSSFGLPAGVDL